MAAGDMQQRNPMDNIQSILNIFKGAPGSTTTNTSSETVSNDKAAAYIKSILEGSSGLATVSSGQKAAGMYSSTTNQQLTNDLLARTSAQTAALSSQKTSSQVTKGNAQLNPLTTLGAAALGQVLTPVAKAAGKATGLNTLGDNIATALFPGKPKGIEDALGGDTTPSDIVNFAPNPTAMPTPNLPDMQAGDIKVADGSTTSGGGGGGTDVASMLGTAGASAGIGAALAGGSEAAGAAGTAAALTDASYAIGGTGTFMAADAGATAATAAGGADILGTLATAAAAWIICTELNKQGRLPYRYYIYGAREFAKYDERGKQGYYIWAIPSVKHLRKHPYSLYSRIMKVVFNARAEYLAAKAGCKEARKSTLGFLTTHGLYALCWSLSRTIAKKSYTKEQILNARA